LEIEKVALNKLKFDPTNARKHSARNIEVIANSLKDFGQRKPIVVTAFDVVVAGNGTLEAAKTLGWKDIEIVRVPEDWTEEQTKAFALTDNRSAELAEWDTSALASQLLELSDYFDIQDFGFNPLVQQEVETPPTDFPDFSNDAKTAYCCPKCNYEWNGAPK